MLNIHTKQNTIFLIKKRKSTGIKHLDESKTFIEYSNNVDNIYQKY